MNALPHPPSAGDHPHLALLVEHDVDTRRIYSEYLKQFAFEVEEASDGREALVKALTGSYDVIVTETRLPFIDGCALCDVLRHDAATRTTPILVMTDETFKADADRALRAGADTVLVKPCLPETLLAELHRVLERSTGARAQAGATPAARAHAEEPARSRARASRQPLSHAHRRGDTTAPPLATPALVCPECDKPLEYRRSQIGGVSARHPEQWDYYECTAGCGTFQYRQRTRRLRKVP
jgi:two-component system cell cycle response regulator DivK